MGLTYQLVSQRRRNARLVWDIQCRKENSALTCLWFRTYARCREAPEWCVAVTSTEDAKIHQFEADATNSGHSHWHDFSHKQSRSPNPSVPPSELHLPRSTNFSSMRENGTQANGLPPPVTPSREGIDLSGETDEIDSLEDGTRPLMSRSISSSTLRIEASKKTKALPMTLGLVIHSLADGLALGAAASSTEDSGMELSIVVFLALIIHKGEQPFADSFTFPC